ncbi:phytanoyl-CoA dioxygenase family protein [Paenibacillus koleovorans]|uniref:phytanoyl-CoA dioxygenase family protein n=1 Tax=Paenibacillus koleovorans TaxID=121608 RepID=UPI000FD7B31B|nr:phytanoyl-CoA dioxygenase family protein [Paenibacillus koleovorans]
MSQQTNQLPDLRQPYALTEDEIAGYAKDGHIMLRHVATQAEVEAYRPVIGEMVRQLNKQSKPLTERDTYGKAFIQIGNIWTKSEAVQRFVYAKRFAKIAADLMGVDRVRIYADQALYKEPGGGHTPWHQDQIYWPLDTDKTITMWMPLVPIPQEVGSMTFGSGTHTNGYISKQVISDDSHKTLREYIESKGVETINHGGMAAGDATFHAGWTLHSAPSNPTEQMREVMTIIFFADDSRLLEPDSNARKNDLASWFPGLQPGDLAAGPLHPILFDRNADTWAE